MDMIAGLLETSKDRTTGAQRFTLAPPSRGLISRSEEGAANTLGSDSRLRFLLASKAKVGSPDKRARSAAEKYPVTTQARQMCSRVRVRIARTSTSASSTRDFGRSHAVRAKTHVSRLPPGLLHERVFLRLHLSVHLVAGLADGRIARGREKNL